MKNLKCKQCNNPIGPTSRSMLCKKCYAEDYRKNHPDYNKNYYKANSTIIKERAKKWANDNREHRLVVAKKNREQRDFDSKRTLVLQRDNYTCQMCNKYYGKENSSKLIVHHKDRLGRGSNIKNNNENNLITECRSCHIKEHHKEMKAKLAEKDKNRWARHYDKCIKCGTTTIKHQAKGLCINCYARMLNKQKKI